MALKSGDSDWQLEAANEQLDIFDSLTVPFECMKADDSNKLVAAILIVLKKHLRLKERTTLTISKITNRVAITSLSKCETSKIKSFNFSFVVIVTNQKSHSNGLCKIPIFFLNFGSFTMFLDIEGNVFKSWSAFIQNKILTGCSFCYPVSGHYDVGGKLEIDFASPSPTKQSLGITSMFWSVVGNIVGASKIAASCLIKVAPICFNIIKDLMRVAQDFISAISERRREIVQLGLLFFNFRNGNMSAVDLMLKAYNLIIPLAVLVQNQVSAAWEGVKKSLQKAYKELEMMFPEYFYSASESSQHEFLAITERVDSETVTVYEEASRKINNILKHSTEDKQDFRTTNHQIFRNCITESALQSSETFNKTTKRMLGMSKKIADNQQVTTLHDLKYIFESISSTVFDEYRHSIETYTKNIKAAEDASKFGFDVNAFNKSLNVKGDPQDHFMEEAMENALKSLRLQFKVNSKVSDLKNNTNIVLIPLWKKDSDDDIDGLYKCIGARGKGKCSAEALLKVLQENFGLSKCTPRVIESGFMMTISSNDFSVLISQEVLEENTSEGIVFVQRNC